MYARLLAPDREGSFFLFGPRGTGKSLWARTNYPDAIYLDLLDVDLFTRLHAAPHRLEGLVAVDEKATVVIDEVQKIPALLDEVHRLIETAGRRFVLTGSSARKLRRGGVNLLAGRARTRTMHPLVADELGADFSVEHALCYGLLPSVYVQPDPADYLRGYVATYLKEEVLQEGLTRDLGAFSRFLEAAAFSQGSPLNVSEVARECSVHRKVVEGYFVILNDLLLSVHLPVFTKRAKRKLVSHPKFYFFDAGVYRAIRAKGPLDRPEEIDGVALETVVLQFLRALNDYRRLGYDLHYWRTRNGAEVDFVLYGERGIRALEVKRSSSVRSQDLSGLRAFLREYPEARATLLYGGSRRYRDGNIDVIPLEEGLRTLGSLLE